MVSTDSNPGAPARQKYRRTVRIVSRPPVSYVSAISLALAVGAAFLMILSWRWWTAETISPPRVRTVSDLEWTWKCELGHTFRAGGQYQPKVCRQGGACDRRAYPIATYICPEHGPFEGLVRFSNGDISGVSPPPVSHVRLSGGDWAPVEQLRCPRCATPLVYKPKDPLAGVTPRRTPRGK